MLTCLIRKLPVAPTPEEKVRQALLSHMIQTAAYPIGLIGVELELSTLPHLIGQKVPKRRADIIVFSPNTMAPLLLVECKAVPLNNATKRQAIGYNLFIKAHLIVLANGSDVQTGCYNGQEWEFQPGLPHFGQISQF